MIGSHAVAFVSGIVVFLAILAAFSRIAVMPEAPKLIRSGADAVAKLFNGVFA